MNHSFRLYNLDKRRCWTVLRFGEMLKSGGAVGLTFKLLNGITTDPPEDPLKGHPHVPARKIDVERSVIISYLVARY